jgi:hypothetical protein
MYTRIGSLQQFDAFFDAFLDRYGESLEIPINQISAIPPSHPGYKIISKLLARYPSDNLETSPASTVLTELTWFASYFDGIPGKRVFDSFAKSLDYIEAITPVSAHQVSLFARPFTQCISKIVEHQDQWQKYAGQYTGLIMRCALAFVKCAEIDASAMAAELSLLRVPSVIDSISVLWLGKLIAKAVRFFYAVDADSVLNLTGRIADEFLPLVRESDEGLSGKVLIELCKMADLMELEAAEAVLDVGISRIDGRLAKVICGAVQNKGCELFLRVFPALIARKDVIMTELCDLVANIAMEKESLLILGSVPGVDEREWQKLLSILVRISSGKSRRRKVREFLSSL